MGMPRARTAWLSVFMTRGESHCFHEGVVGVDSLDEYFKRLHESPKFYAGDSSSLIPYYIEHILTEFPRARWAVVYRDSNESKASLMASEDKNLRPSVEDYWPEYMARWDAAFNLLKRRSGTQFFDFHKLTLKECRALSVHCISQDVSEEGFKKLDNLKITVHPKRIDSPVAKPVVPLPPFPFSPFYHQPERRQGLYARAYSSLDFELLYDWCHKRTGHPLNESRLPPMGIIVEDQNEYPIVALFAQLAVDRGIAFLEDPIARPGISLKESREAFDYAFEALKSALKANNYTGIVAHTPFPQIVRELERRHGFTAVSNELTKLELQI